MIYIIVTASIINNVGVKNDNHRKNRYIDSIKQLLELTKNDNMIKTIIVENNGVRETYLDNLGCDILYTNNNKIRCKHKGDNELLDIKDVINKYGIKDEDMIIKITGRYKLLSDDFINLVKNNIDTYDAFIKFYNVAIRKYMNNDCVLGLFAIKCKYLKQFNYKFKKSGECEFAEYVRENVDKNKIMEINKLDLECCFACNLVIMVV